MLKRLWQAARKNDLDSFKYWAQMAHAFRDTKELRSEDSNRARAIVRLLKAMPDVIIPIGVSDELKSSSLAAIAWPAQSVEYRHVVFDRIGPSGHGHEHRPGPAKSPNQYADL